MREPKKNESEAWLQNPEADYTEQTTVEIGDLLTKSSVGQNNDQSRF